MFQQNAVADLHGKIVDADHPPPPLSPLPNPHQRFDFLHFHAVSEKFGRVIGSSLGWRPLPPPQRNPGTTPGMQTNKILL